MNVMYHKLFGSWGEFLDHCLSKKPDYCRSESSRDGGDRQWYGTPTYESAEKLAREGWREGTGLVAARSKAMVDKVAFRIIKQDYTYDVCDGIGFDVALVASNIPEHWMRPIDVESIGQSTRFVRIRFNMAVSAGVSADVIRAKGAAVAALVELLEYGGCRVELTTVAALGAGYGRDGKVAVWEVKVKDYDQPLDMGRVAYALVHPSMFRRHIFSAMERSPQEVVESVTHCSYGMPTDSAHAEDEVYIGKALLGDSQWLDPASAESWIIDQLKAQGIELRA